MLKRHWALSALAAMVMALSATVLRAALPPKPDLSGPTSVMGQLLIATDALHGPPFEHSVILVAQHNKDGALGLVINHPVGKLPMSNLLKAFGVDSEGVTGAVQIFSGGPVDPDIGFVLHSAEYRNAATMDIDGRVALTSGRDVLRAIADGKGPHKILIALGYAGWGPSQLDRELANGFWDTVGEDSALVFDDERAKVWDDAMARYKSSH